MGRAAKGSDLHPADERRVEQRGDHRDMSSFVDSAAAAVPRWCDLQFGLDLATARGRGEGIGMADLETVITEGDAKGIVEELPEVCRRRTRRAPGDVRPVHVGRDRAAPGENGEKFGPFGLVGFREVDVDPEPTRAGQGIVELEDEACRRRDEEPARCRNEAVEARKKGSQGRLASSRRLPVSGSADQVDLVDEHDAPDARQRREDGPDPGGRQLVGGELVEGQVGADRASQPASRGRLARAWRPMEEEATREHATGRGNELGMAETTRDRA